VSGLVLLVMIRAAVSDFHAIAAASAPCARRRRVSDRAGSEPRHRRDRWRARKGVLLPPATGRRRRSLRGTATASLSRHPTNPGSPRAGSAQTAARPAARSASACRTSKCRRDAAPWMAQVGLTWAGRRM